MKKKQVVTMVMMVSLVVLAMAGAAFAFTAPTGAATEVGGSLYDLIVTKFIQGPIGSAAGVVLMVVGGIAAALGKMAQAAWPLVGGGILVAAPTLATSLGMIF